MSRFVPPRRVLARLGLLLGLAALTAWNLTRSHALTEATAAYARGDLTRALQRALDHLDRRPWSRSAALVAARCLSRLDFAEAAEPYYRRAGELDLNDQQIRAYGLVRGNHRQKAVEAYEQILARWPENVTALRRLAAVRLTENNAPQLEALSRRLIATPGGAAMGYTLQGAVAHQDHNHERTVEAFEKVLQLDPGLREMPLPRPAFWNYLASALIKVGRHEDAVRYLVRALDSAPDAELMLLLGQAHALQGRVDEASRSYRQAAEWDPKNYLPHLNLGKLELQEHRPDLAVEHLEQALKRAPRQLDVLRNLVVAYQLLQRPADAARIQQSIAQLQEQRRSARHPKDPWPQYAL